MEPEELAKGSAGEAPVGDDRESWIARMDGVIVRPSGPTCFASVEGTCIDYFLMQSSLAHSLKAIEVQDGSTIATHKPVHLYLQRVRRPLLARVRCQPRALHPLPAGCPPKPVPWQSARTLISSAIDGPSLDLAWSEVLGKVEEGILNRYDIVGKDRAVYSGRAHGANLSCR